MIQPQMRNRPYLLLTILLLVTLACSAPAWLAPTPFPSPAPPSLPESNSTPSPQPTPTALPPTPAPPLSSATLKNAVYRLVDFPDLGQGGSFQLENGEYHQAIAPGSASEMVVRLDRFAVGDLNGDGLADAVVLLGVNTGGSGTFMDLVALLNQGEEQPLQAATRPLGYRTKVEGLQIASGRVQIEMVTHAPEDPLCCPSLHVKEEYRLQDGQLVTQLESTLFSLAREIVQSLRECDTATLAKYVHPTLGVRFAPYTYVRPEYLVFGPGQVKDLASDPERYTWGVYDGSGAPIILTFSEYLDKFIYCRDFAAATQVSLNRPIGSGNSINNIAEFYPGAAVVEFFIPGTEQYGGMDWHSLRLVFQPEGEKWTLIAIINDQWTI